MDAPQHLDTADNVDALADAIANTFIQGQQKLKGKHVMELIQQGSASVDSLFLSDNQELPQQQKAETDDDHLDQAHAIWTQKLSHFSPSVSRRTSIHK